MQTRHIKAGRIIPLILVTGVIVAVLLSYYRRSHSTIDVGTQKSRLLPEHIAAATEGFSVFQSERGPTTFEIKAKINLGYKDNKNLLESVTVKVFGKEANRYDTITSRYCEYDQGAEEIVFWGDVVITLSHWSNNKKNVEKLPDAETTIIKVNKIRYLQKTGKAHTEDEVHFSRGRIHGSSRGLTYDTDQESIHLHSNVEIFLEPAGSQDSRVHLESDRLWYFKDTNQVEMQSNVRVTKALDEIQADSITAYLDHQNSSLVRIDASRDVRSVSRDPRILSSMYAPHVTYDFGSSGRWPERVTAKGGVQIRSLSQEIKRNMTSERMEILLLPGNGSIERVDALGDVVAVLSDHHNPSLPPATKRDQIEPGDRILKAPRVRVFFKAERSQIARMEAHGPSVLREVPVEPSDEEKVLSAGLLTLFFGEESDRAERFVANDHVTVDLIPVQGAAKKTSSDHLVAFLEANGGQINRLRQFGNFVYQEGDRSANADEAEYLSQGKTVSLWGHPEVRDSQSRTTADRIELNQSEGLVRARGRVRSVLYARDGGNGTGMFQPRSPVYASAESLEVQTDRGIAIYRTKAKLWQADQIVRAEAIKLDRDQRMLTAENNVTSLFYFESEEEANSGSNRKPVTIQAGKMTYEEEHQQISYEGNVKTIAPMGVMNSQRLDVFMQSQEERTAVERMLATGKVRIFQSHRTSFSDSAEYFRGKEKVILEGGPPRVVDPERGSTSGARLTISLDDDSISVEGDSKTRSITRQRVAR